MHLNPVSVTLFTSYYLMSKSKMLDWAGDCESASEQSLKNFTLKERINWHVYMR